MTITHVFDSSAFLAHALGEPGGDQVTALWADVKNTVGISALCIVEIKTRLRETISDVAEQRKIYSMYRSLVTVLSVTEEIAEEAEALRARTRGRVPLADALVAATAKIHGAILVHRDEHIFAIAHNDVVQLHLPPKRKA